MFKTNIKHRIVELSDEAKRIRPPIRFHSDKIIRPYNLVEATGYAILQVNIHCFAKKKIYINEFGLQGICVEDVKRTFFKTITSRWGLQSTS